MYYGGEKNIKRNLKLFFIDGIFFMPTLTLLSITTVIPFFLETLGASTFHIALAASMSMICTFLSQPMFGALATRTKILHKTFGKILMLQRVVFTIFVLSIPFLASNHSRLIWIFLIFWGIFNLFVGSYSVFFVPLLLKLLPPDRRGTLRGIGFAIGNGLGLIMAALIPVVLGNIIFPYNFMMIFLLGCVFLLINATVFLSMAEHEDTEPREGLTTIQFIKGIPTSIKNDKPFRSMILMSMFLVVANALLTFYTLYALRIFDANENHIALLAGLAVAANAVGFIVFGFIVDKMGAVFNALLSAILIILAGVIALFTNSLNFLFVAWVFANLGSSAYGTVASLLIGEVAPSGKVPLYAGAQGITSLALSSVVLLVIAPILENIDFSILFIVVISCGVLSLLINRFSLNTLVKKLKSDE